MEHSSISCSTLRTKWMKQTTEATLPPTFAKSARNWNQIVLAISLSLHRIINLLVVCNTIESQAYPAMTISARLKSPLASTLLRQSGEVLSQPFINFSGNLQDGMQLINNLFRGIACHVYASISINWFHDKYRATVLKRDLPPAAAAVHPAVSSSSLSEIRDPFSLS